MPPITKKYKIVYLKSYDYKTSFITGMTGAVSPNGLISVNFFADRPAMPKMVNIETNENNVVLSSVEEKENDMVREAQFGALMDINTTKMFVEWLNGRIKEFEETFKTKTT